MPQKPSLRELEDLMAQLVFPFYQIERIAIPPIEPRRFENDAEHSWSLAFMACSLAPRIDKTLDLGIIAQFAIVHDLIEIFAGDTTPWQDKSVRKSKEAREREAQRLIAQKFAHFPWITQTIEEYERKASPEAKFVWALDKVIMLLMRYMDRGQYYIDHGITKKHFDEGLVLHRKKASAYPAVAAYYEELLELFERHPEFFHR